MSLCMRRPVSFHRPAQLPRALTHQTPKKDVAYNPRPSRGALRRVDRIGRRSVRRGFPAAGVGKGRRHADVGGEIWLTSSNTLVDRGIATAAEFGVYSPEREWLIEGHGVVPDIFVDNPPRTTFGGSDAQLDAAIQYLKEKIAKEPVDVPAAPAYPKKK